MIMPSKSTQYRRQYLSGAASCRFNAHVNCASHDYNDCRGCGWNPAEEMRRKEALYNGGTIPVKMESVGV